MPGYGCGWITGVLSSRSAGTQSLFDRTPQLRSTTCCIPQELTVCSQSTHGSTWQPQRGTAIVDLVMTPGDCLAGALAVPPEGSLAACRFGIQRMNGVRSATSVMYQSFLAGSQRAPKAFTASFSAKGVTRLILMDELLLRCWRHGSPPHKRY